MSNCFRQRRWGYDIAQIEPRATVKSHRICSKENTVQSWGLTTSITGREAADQRYRGTKLCGKRSGACVCSTPFSAIVVDQAVEDERLRIASGGRDAAVTLERFVPAPGDGRVVQVRDPRRDISAPLRRDPVLPVGDQRVLGEEPGQCRP
jgi:hypothetical protein